MAGQLWAVNSLGGYMSSKELSKKLRHAVQPMCKFRQFADVKDASQQGKGKGETFTWNVYGNVASAGGILTETNTIPETNFTITQGTLTIGEGGNAVPYSGKLDNLSEHPLKTIINKTLKHDTAKFLDRQAYVQFEATPLRVIPSAGTSSTAVTLYTNGTVTGTNSIAYNNSHAKAISDIMRERNIPPFEGDDYMAIAWPTTLRTFKNNLETIHQYTEEGLRMIKNGEIGRYEKTRYVEQTNIPHGITNATATTGTAWTVGASDWIFFFGEDTVAEAICVPEEIRGKIPTDYGRSQGVAWYYLGGHGLVHTSADQARVVMWDSLA